MRCWRRRVFIERWFFRRGLRKRFLQAPYQPAKNVLRQRFIYTARYAARRKTSPRVDRALPAVRYCVVCARDFRSQARDVDDSLSV